MCDEISSPSPSFNGATAEIWEQINSVVPVMWLLIHACDQSQAMVAKQPPDYEVFEHQVILFIVKN